MYSRSCTEASLGGSGYVCDIDKDVVEATQPNTPPTPCRKNVGEPCVVTTDCWNDDGGNWCNSISKCTDGANGRACGTGTDCDSGNCCSGVCSSTSCSQMTDLSIVDIIPIQVIPNVNLVKEKTGYVRVIVNNNGLYNATSQVSVTLDGATLTSTNNTKFILNGTNQTFDFSFSPSQTGSRTFAVQVITI